MASPQPPRPFTFDHRVFDDQLVVDKPQPKYTENDLTAAQAEAFAKGRDEGLREEREGQTRKACDLLVRLLAENTRLEQGIAEQATRLVGDAGELARRILAKLMPMATARGGLEEIESLIASTLLEQHTAPRISIHVAPAMQATVNELVERLRKDTAFEGKLAILSDETFGESDCRLEWATGGAERMLDKIWNDINTCISKATPQGEPS
ncbi:MAG TPA: hypothetical protein DCW68_03220 [Rhodospirillaceae bacterium]|nr:MAG: hypothetical protein A2018_06195 [Alphaproteobacteria bacterium GWF2_58_20]HAU29103.1 hypothetical protein [Rhodospirillaceae bacterium]